MYNGSASCPSTEASYTLTSPIAAQTNQTNNGYWVCLFGKDSLGNWATDPSAYPINIDITGPSVGAATIYA